MTALSFGRDVTSLNSWIMKWYVLGSCWNVFVCVFQAYVVSVTSVRTTIIRVTPKVCVLPQSTWKQKNKKGGLIGEANLFFFLLQLEELVFFLQKNFKPRLVAHHRMPLTRISFFRNPVALSHFLLLTQVFAAPFCYHVIFCPFPYHVCCRGKDSCKPSTLTRIYSLFLFPINEYF